MNKAKRLIIRNKKKLDAHNSGNPMFELSFEEVDKL